MSPPRNNSSAVVAGRKASRRSVDDFPSPPWAVRALFEYVLPRNGLHRMTAFEPTCNRGWMADVLREKFGTVIASDLVDYGYEHGTARQDFLMWTPANRAEIPDWIIMNPPYTLAGRFAERAIMFSRIGTAMLLRMQFVEGETRWEGLFKPSAPTVIAAFVERVSMVPGTLDRKASRPTLYAWFVWEHDNAKFYEPAGRGTTDFMWIPPCKKRLERDSDYEPRPPFGPVDHRPYGMKAAEAA